MIQRQTAEAESVAEISHPSPSTRTHQSAQALGGNTAESGFRGSYASTPYTALETHKSE